MSVYSFQKFILATVIYSRTPMKRDASETVRMHVPIILWSVIYDVQKKSESIIQLHENTLNEKLIFN